MGISDDIKPKHTPEISSKDSFVDDKEASPKLTSLENANISDTAIKDESISRDAEAEDKNEIHIDKSGINKPVFEDLYPPLPEHPFEHLKQEDAPLKDTPKQDKPSDKMKSDKSFHDHYNAPENQHKKPYVLIIFIILFVLSLAALLVWQNIDQVKKLLNYGNKNTATEQSSGSGNGVEIVSGQDYTDSGSENNTPAATSSTPDQASTTTDSTPAAASSTPVATPTAVPSTINLSSLKVSVLNGNGITGTAAAVRDTLVAAGYTIDRVANATNFNYQSTTIYYATGKKAEAEAIAQVLSSRTVVSYLNDTVVGSRDIIVVVGKK